MIFKEVLNEAQIEIVEKPAREITLPKDIKNERFNVP
jgi:hypothetical protein